MASGFSPVTKVQPEEHKRVTEVTYLRVVCATLAALKRMLPRDRGFSRSARRWYIEAFLFNPHTSAAKQAIAGFTDSLRCELIHDKSNVRVITVPMPIS
jgi:NAD(P)-dependent dehydrogenase (short-subunit alcohol dehydrogenase family)